MYAWLSRHPRLVDGVPAAFLLLLGLATAVGSATRREQVGPGGQVVSSSPVSAFGTPPAVLLVLLILLGLAVPVVFRRTYPVQAFTVAAVAGALQVVFILSPLGTDLSILILLYTLAAYRPRRGRRPPCGGSRTAGSRPARRRRPGPAARLPPGAPGPGRSPRARAG